MSRLLHLFLDRSGTPVLTRILTPTVCLFIAAFTVACRTAPITPEKQTPKAEAPKQIDFGGVSFSYDASLFTDIRAETVEASPLENADDKPDYVLPRHVLFKIAGPYASQRKYSHFKPTISVYPLDGFPQAYAISQDSVKGINAEIKKLRTLLSQTSSPQEGQIPYLPFIDATQTFQAHVKRVDFQGGKGILFLTQYDIEPSLVNNLGLTYMFEGITVDGLYYVLAEFPIDAPGLPNDSFEGLSHEGYTVPPLPYSPDAQKAHEQYVAGVVRKLEELQPNQFDPDLSVLEKVVRTINVHGTL